MWRVDTLGGPVCWVVLARNIFGMDGKLVRFEEGMNSAKDEVCVPVAAAATFPGINDALVIPINPKILCCRRLGGKGEERADE